jgi:hypothetical protein
MFGRRAGLGNCEGIRLNLNQRRHGKPQVASGGVKSKVLLREAYGKTRAGNTERLQDCRERILSRYSSVRYPFTVYETVAADKQVKTRGCKRERILR